MSLLLYIESYQRKKMSASIEIANVFLEEYKKAHPSDEVEVVDLWHTEIPEFDGDVIDAKYSIMHGQSQTEAQRKAWRKVEHLISQFKQGDKYLISLPMWNYSIPYKLKQYIDVIVQPSYTFTFSPEQGYKGLVVNKPAALIYARGGDYHEGSGAESLDLQIKYMETILKFIGFTDFRNIVVEPTLAGQDQKDRTVQKAKGEAIQVASQF
ncbi:MAG: FMN-dependent NADH-azoreductase [Chlamydiales bacterium]